MGVGAEGTGAFFARCFTKSQLVVKFLRPQRHLICFHNLLENVYQNVIN